MSQQQVNLFNIALEDFFEEVESYSYNCLYNYKKHSILIADDDQDKLGIVRLPLHLELDDELDITDDEVVVLYLSIEAGNAAICIQEGKETIYHTTFSAYMTRKKQGFSQVKYLNKKGKSRAGSRVRLASTIEFFENINEILTELFDEIMIERIAISCTPTLLPYLYQSKVVCPFSKDDERLYKIPLHIPQSNYTNLSATIKKLMAPMLFFDVSKENIFHNVMKSLK